MKKIAAVFAALALVFSLCSCGGEDSSASINSPGETDLRETVSHENESEKNSSAQSDGSLRYGEKTGTDKTYTGLEPLELIEFTVSDPDNEAQLSTEKISHSFGVAENGQAHEISIANQKRFDEGGFDALTLDNKSDEKVVYLTFDVGYDNGYTGMILDTLAQKGVTAAFFCTVGEMESDPESIARMINEGHIVGNHTDTHPSMDELSRQEMALEIKAFDDYIRTNFGYSAPYFRFPKGEYSDCALELVGSLGYTSVFWSLAYSDWDVNNQKGADYALDTVVSRLHPGAVILLHAVSSDNAQALGDIIDAARSMGYEFKSLDDYSGR